MENKKTADFETVSFDSQYNRSIEQPNPDQWLLDHFAGLAMQSLVLSQPDEPVMAIAKTAYSIAETMLKARKELSND